MSDDWFERALEDEDADESGASEPRDDSEHGDGADSSDGPDDATTRKPTGNADDLDAAFDANPDADDFDAAFDADPDADDREETADTTASAESDDDADSSEGALFETSFGDALQNVDVPGMEGSGASDGAQSDSEADPFAAESVGVDGSAGPEGFSEVEYGLESPDQPDYDADVESALSRIDLGVEGLDRMIQGGVPERSLMVAIGSAGTGKTTFGLQFLNHALEDGESAVFITLEESRQRLIDSATEKGFPFDEYVAEDRLAIVDLDPVEMTNSLASIRNELPRLIENFGASRLVLDSVSLLEMMYDDRAKRRNEIYDFTAALKEAGVTTLLTSEAAEDTPYASRHGIVEYLTDAVFVMQYVRPDDFRETRLAIEIQKIRDANHSREKKPYELTDDGISVYQQANLF
ncbi:KaiC domain-containing protein [Natronolimnobius baerhuensis]|uniref:KaiC domain-containing protein n=1 Tax=Natronolimnobius baerhuensis TaxID=253108 RepID=A0A202E685_9EURY|nr:KaiC domain-containing protein [Natronolimnobius baerhuensis]OVE83782.1 KaiC domain-containing protein [Natronolimnobius baerhuensis]